MTKAGRGNSENMDVVVKMLIGATRRDTAFTSSKLGEQGLGTLCGSLRARLETHASDSSFASLLLSSSHVAQAPQ